MSLLLGIDEGTSAVKAVLFDTDLRPVAEARREKPLAHPKPGWVEQDPRQSSRRWSERWRGARRRPTDEVVACGLDHQGESVLAWDAESGRPLTPVVTWQDKRSQEILDRLEADGADAEVVERSGMPLDPYFSAAQAHLAARARRGGAQRRASRGRCASAPSTRCSATGSAPASRPTPRPRRAPSSVPRSGTRELLEVYGVPGDVLPEIADTAGDLGTLAPRVLAGRSCRCARAASTSRRRSPARAAWCPAWSRRPTGPGSSSSPTPATSGPARAAACCRPSPGESTAASSGRSTAGSSPPGRCSSG